MNLTRKSAEDSFQYRGIFYDKLLLAIRDSVLLPEEVYEIRAEYTKDLNNTGNNDMILSDEINMRETGSMSTLTHNQSTIQNQSTLHN